MFLTSGKWWTNLLATLELSKFDSLFDSLSTVHSGQSLRNYSVILLQCCLSLLFIPALKDEKFLISDGAEIIDSWRRIAPILVVFALAHRYA
jgi:hypothetical protein